MMVENLLSIQGIWLENSGEKITWEISRGQNWLLRGDINSGKTKFLSLITGTSFRFEEKVIHYFEDKPAYGFASLNKHLTYLNFRGLIADHHQFYYQQRYNSTESENIATLRNILFPGEESVTHDAHRLIRMFGLTQCLDEEIIKLSSGEYRKASIIKAILLKPEFLILDEPYSGLDAPGIKQMDDLLGYIAGQSTGIILSSNTSHIPPVISHVFVLARNAVCYKGPLSDLVFPSVRPTPAATLPYIPEMADVSFNTAFQMTDTTVKYGNRIILNRINWQVEKGDKWLLSGRNGAGKSMLLSLVYADNPQVYANDIKLFDRRRGTGESIWEVKERIGYFSSELFLYYDKLKTTTTAAFRYLSSNPYNRKKVTKDEMAFYTQMLEYFDVTVFDGRPLFSVPFEVQRIFLLMNVFLGNAPLIILDEPYHGLDEATIEKINRLVTVFCSERTLIFVSHNRDEIPPILSKEFLLDHGEGRTVQI